ncbi:MAG: WG repeat-containing protein [Tannerella sp.]|jgi:hypothetical protein|nr:WG repeat-containing protein [Tannerella sp.]
MEQSDYDYRDTCEELYGVSVVGKNGKYGYINSRGKEITPLKYDRTMRFNWDVGRVQLDGKWGLVNKKGKEVTPPIYDEIKGHQDPIVRLGNKYGFISRKTGELLTPIKYDNAKQWTQILKITSNKSGHSDLATVQLDGKWGCINLKGKEITPIQFDEIEINQLDKPTIAALFNGKWGFIDDKGKEITAFVYDDVESFRCGRARVKKEGKFGYVNRKGKEVIPVNYDDCEPYFSWRYINDEKQLRPVWVKSGNQYGYINIEGKEIIKPQYELAKSFDRIENRLSLAVVVQNGLVGFIDESGETVIPFRYEPDFDNRLNYCFYSGFADVKLGGKWGVIDEANNNVIPFIYDEFLKNQHAGFRYALRNGEKWSVDRKGNEWKMQKNPASRTFKDYLSAVEWIDVAESFKELNITDKNDMEIDVEQELKIYEANFYNFKTKQFESSDNIIRIFSDSGCCGWKRPLVDAAIFSVADDCSYGIFDWAEIPDMEVRIEDNLTFTDADIVAICIWEAGDQMPVTEKGIRCFLGKLDEQIKTMNEK